jgi:tRNA threonylcarbamoyladenosine biosynthesis protein TsaB
MNILAVDSSSENLSIALFSQGRVLFNFNRRLKFGSSKLIPFIGKYLRENRFDLNMVDAFAIGRGPGSFTGLRVSFSVIKAFMITMNKPVVCIDSFYSMAYPFAGKYKKIAVISDARRGLVYAATFSAKNNLLKKEEPPKLVALRDFVPDKSGYFFVSGDEHLYGELAKSGSGINFFHKAVYPKTKYYLKIANDLAGRGKFTAVHKLEPLYLHPKTCQIRAQKAEGGSKPLSPGRSNV